jgi:hypothetical protein
MIPVFENEYLRITARQALSDERSGGVLLSFTGVGHAMGGIDVQQPEFFGAGRGFDNIIFVSDLTRSWGNHIDFPLLAERVAPFIAGRRVFCIGNSMGGFLAILASRYIEIEASISFAPQYSINPETAPWEDRWKK